MNAATTKQSIQLALEEATAQYKAGNVLAIYRFVTNVLGYKGGDAMRATRRYKSDLGLTA